MAIVSRSTRAVIVMTAVLVAIVTGGYAAGVSRKVAKLTTGYREVQLPAADPVLCESECVGDTQCKSFTYVKPGVLGASAMCILKKEAPSTVVHDCCISKVRPAVTRAHAESVLYQAHEAWKAQTRVQAS